MSSYDGCIAAFQVRDRRRASIVSNEHDHVYSNRTSPLTSQQGKGRQGGISASGETKFILNQPRQSRSRTIPANGTMTSTAAAARASCRFDAPALNIGSTDTDRQKRSLGDPQRWAGERGINRGAKRNGKRDGSEGGDRGEEYAKGWSI